MKSELENQWDVAARLLLDDPMRSVRLGMAYSVLKSLPTTSSLLEVGSGEGSGLSYLKSKGWMNLNGVEVSSTRIGQRPESSELNVVHLPPDWRILPYPDSHFDVVMSLAVIEHVVDREGFVREICRVAKPAGLVFISSDCFSWRILQLMGRYRSVQPIDRTCSLGDFITLFSSAGLSLNGFATFNLSERGPVIPNLLLPGFIRKLIYKPAIHHPRSFCDAVEVNSHLKLGRLKKSHFIRNLFDDENIFFLSKRVA